MPLGMHEPECDMSRRPPNLPVVAAPAAALAIGVWSGSPFGGRVEVRRARALATHRGATAGEDVARQGAWGRRRPHGAGEGRPRRSQSRRSRGRFELGFAGHLGRPFVGGWTGDIPFFE